jgi:hypothetical protein
MPQYTPADAVFIGRKSKGTAAMAPLRLSSKHVAGLAIASVIAILGEVILLAASGCGSHCGACLPNLLNCYGELADAATCPARDGACALVEKCMCAAGGCPGVSSAGCRATDQAACNALPGCAWVTVCNFLFDCLQYDNKESCSAQQACTWDPSNGCS